MCLVSVGFARERARPCAIANPDLVPDADLKWSARVDLNSDLFARKEAREFGEKNRDRLLGCLGLDTSAPRELQ
jgi:hypothetical protein